MRRFALLLAVLSVAACTSSNPPPAMPAQPVVANPPSETGEGKVLAYWTQLGPDGTVEARAVISGNECPFLAMSGGQIAMIARARADGEFALICSAPIPPGEPKGVGIIWAIGPKAYYSSYPPLFPPGSVSDPQRILVIGDTGCRLKGSLVQPCNDERQWPFANIARKAADLKPDLVIHVGDYLYRENACPADATGCQGTPFGDNWPTWAADFFTPGQPLLAAAPWVFVRGNHEDCQRAGPGWTRLLAPAPFDPANICADHTPPFSVPLKAMTLVVMDNASAPDTAVDANAVPVYRSELTALGNAQMPVWAVMHRPIWAAVSGPLGVPIGGNATEIEASGKNGIPKPVELLIAGHIHTFEAINYVDNKVPPQILAGGGGDLLDKTPLDLAGTIFQGSSGVSVKDGLSVNGFSFLLMTKAAAGWNIQLYDQDGVPFRSCNFAGGRVDCPVPKK
jgi:hypothetical protein